jgi:predicted transcriptional regulator
LAVGSGLKAIRFVDFHLHLSTEPVGATHPGPPCCVEPQTTIRQAIEQMREQRTGGVLVCRDGVLVGVFTERDALALIAKEGNFDAPIEQVMVKSPVTVSENSSVGAAIHKMSSGGYRRLPLVDDGGKPLGVVKVSGILRYLVEHFPQVIYTLPPSPHHNMQQREGA